MPMSVAHTRVPWFEDGANAATSREGAAGGIEDRRSSAFRSGWVPPIQLRIASTALTRPSTATQFQDAAVRLQNDVVIRTVKYVSDERPRCRAN
jgi:hypothetical protein